MDPVSDPCREPIMTLPLVTDAEILGSAIVVTEVNRSMPEHVQRAGLMLKVVRGLPGPAGQSFTLFTGRMDAPA
jgi:hypothetical protein